MTEIYRKKKIDRMLVDMLGDTLLVQCGCSGSYCDQIQLTRAKRYIKKYGNILKHTINTVRGYKGNTPLHNAVLYYYDYCKLLLKYGANPNICNNNGDTPLHLLIKEDLYDDEYCEERDKYVILLKYGANPNICNNNGDNPLYLSMLFTKININIVKILLNSIMYG